VRELNAGTLTITIQARPEDSRYFDLKVAYERSYRLNRCETDGPRRKLPGLSGAGLTAWQYGNHTASRRENDD
jgi:hypothetical protein